jgi:hypothetical protein
LIERRIDEAIARGDDLSEGATTYADYTERVWPELFVEVICKRCGYTERFFAPILLAAEAPIRREDR